MKRSLLYTLLFCLSLSLYSVQGQVSYRSETPYIIFAKGKKMFQVHNYNGCIDLLTRFKTLSKDTKLNQEADYMIAVSSYAESASLKALGKIHRTIRLVLRYPQSPDADRESLPIRPEI